MYAKMIVEIEQKMQASLDNKQLSELHQVLESVFASFASGETSDSGAERALLDAFLSAKKVEG